MQEVSFKDLGLIKYQEAWDYQEKLFKSIVDNKISNRNLKFLDQKSLPHQLIFCEHPAVYTLGKSGDMKHLLVDSSTMQEKGIDFYKINRGGDITFHGPGQIVGYPIFDLDYFFTDIGKYLRMIEQIVIDTIADYGLKGERLKGSTGVWLDSTNPMKARKICAIGVRTSRWVTMHGFALNVNTDLQYFENIIPCGINDKAVSSIQKELEKKINIEEVKEKLKRNFIKQFNIKLIDEKN